MDIHRGTTEVNGVSPSEPSDLEPAQTSTEGVAPPTTPTPATVSASVKRSQGAPPAKKAPAKSSPRKGLARADGGADKSRRTRRTPLFPAGTFEDAIELATAIFEFGSGQPVRRITLFDNMGKSPDSGSTRQLITNSAKYGLTSGSYAADLLALTPDGRQAVADDVSPASRVRARFKLAIENVDVFRGLYECYLNNRLPAQAVLADKARELGVPDEDVGQCVETFTVNTKYVGVLRSISGAERLLGIDVVIDDFLPATDNQVVAAGNPAQHSQVTRTAEPSNAGFDSSCFYITPIGDEGSEQRKHSDLFMGSLVEPALSEFDLNLVRADMIGEAGMITAQIIEYIVRSKLVIVDLSYHNPNVFYELALRHATRKPIVQISRAADKLPFDIGQVRTVVIDTSDIYSLVPQLESLKAQIAAQIRRALVEKSALDNPLSVFAPYFWSELPSGTE